MKTGTKSLIFGIHQVFLHPILVYRAWMLLYERPTLKELICIIVHDWGYFGKPNLDGKEGTRHPELGAKIAGKLFGKEYEEFCLCHSRHYALILGKEPSKLCWADKLSLTLENKKFYLFRATLSGEMKELRMTAHVNNLIDISESNDVWYNIIIESTYKSVETKTNGTFMHKIEMPMDTAVTENRNMAI